MLKATTHSDVTTLEMNHGKVNAMDLEFCSALIEAIENFEQSTAKCLVLRSGTQNRVFSAGIDLKRITAEPTSYTREYFPKLIRLFEQVYFCSKPTIAAVEGVAIAGGCVMAAGCTRRIGTNNARFGMPNKRLDVPIPQIAPLILQSAVPVEIADALHSDELYSAPAAMDCGLLSKLFQVNEMEQAVADQARELSSNGFEPKKRDANLLSSFQLADQHMIDCWCHEDLRMRISSYISTV